MNKYLVIRFSSFGDIAQCLPAARALRLQDATAEIHFLTRADFADFVRRHTAIDRVWSLRREDGFRGLWRNVKLLNREGFTHVYDAHNNLRSLFTCLALRALNLRQKHVRRSKNRIKRFLLFQFRINLLPAPFRGIHSYLEPLNSWFKNVQIQNPEPLALGEDCRPTTTLPHNLSEAVTLAPSANWELKRWPVSYWVQLVKSTPYSFVLLGGPEDTFLNEIESAAPERVTNLAGKLNWTQSLWVLSKTRVLVSGDTGLLHAADMMGRKAIAIIGPTAFGYPSYNTSQVLETSLTCKPCTKDGRGKCTNATFKKCLVDVTPLIVGQKLNEMISSL